MIQACLNGGRRGGVACSRAGLGRRDTLDPAPVADTVAAIREACPDTPHGLTTGLWAAGGDHARRLALIESWPVVPDYVSVKVSEPGLAALCSLLAERGVGIEAGVWSVDDARLLDASGVEVIRVLVEVGGEAPSLEVARAAEISAALRLDAPQLHHGEGLATWAVIDAAAALGHHVRVGLEDTFVLPDGSTASGNAELVAEAARRPGPA